MFRKCLRVYLLLMLLTTLIGISSTASAAGDFRVIDTSNSQEVMQGSTVDLGLASATEIKNRVFRIDNTSDPYREVCVSKFTITNNQTPGAFSYSYTPLYTPPATCAKVIGSTDFGVKTEFGLAPGTYTATVSFNELGGSFSFKVKVRVLESGPAIQVETDDGRAISKNGSFDFGSTQVNTPLNQTFRILNNGDQPLTIDNPTSLVAGEGFSLFTSPPSSIDPGGSATFTVQLLSGSAGNKTGSVSIQSNDPNDNPFSFTLIGTVEAAPAPAISITDASGQSVPKGSLYDVGSTQVNVNLDREFVIHNSGSAALDVNVSVTGSGFSLASGPPPSIAAGDSASFGVRLSSGTAGTKTGQVSISNNDPDDNPYSFNLTGQVVTPAAPRIHVQTDSGTQIPNGSSFDFGSTPVGAALDQTFRIFNDGNATLSIGGVSINSSHFSLKTAPPATIDPGSSGTFVLRFFSTTAGTFSGQVTIENNDPNNSPFWFNASGTALGPEIRVAQAWDGKTIPDGGSFTFPDTSVSNLPISRLFNICNDGNSTLTISNPTSLVSGTGFSRIGTAPASSVAPGACTSFRVRFYVTTPGSYTGAITIYNNDANENPYNISLSARALEDLAPEIRVAQAWDGKTIPDGGSFAFPDTYLSQLPISRLFNICNDGNSTLTISNPTSLVSGTGFSRIGTAPASSVAPGACTSFRVRFYVTTPGSYTGAITIYNNDANENPYNISLSARALADGAPEIRVAQAWDGKTIPDGGSFTFPDTSVSNLPISRLFNICNDGNSTLTISNPTSLVSGTGFSQIGTAPASSVASGACTSFRVRFHVTVPGFYTGAITIYNNDANENPYNISLSARATQ